MTRARSYLAPLALYGGLSLILLLSSGLIVRKYPHDLYYLLDAAWRAELGQLPHVDFQSPIGQSMFWIYGLVTSFGTTSVFTVAYANVLVAGIAAGLGLATLRRRLPPLLLFLAVGIVVGVTLSPRSIDFGILQYDWLAPYNRWGWSFAIVLALTVTLRPREADMGKSGMLDGIVVGAILAFLFYLKINFFLGTAVLAVTATAAGGFRLRALLVAGLTLLLGILAVELLVGNTSAYLQDLGRAAAANRHEGYTINVVETVYAAFVGGVFWAAGVGALLLASPPRPLRAWLASWWRPLLMFTLVVGAGVGIGVQNHPTWESGMHCAALILLAELVRRARAESASQEGPGESPREGRLTRWRQAAPAAAAVFFAGALVILDSSSVAAHAVESRLAARCTSPVLRDTPMEDLTFAAENLLLNPSASDPCSAVLSQPVVSEPPRIATAVDRRLLRTVTALRRFARPGDVVLALEFSNPYPIVFRAPPPQGALIWLDRGRSYSTKVHPDPAKLLQGVDLVVQTDYPSEVSTASRIGAELRASLMSVSDLDGTGFGQDAWAVYGPTVKRHFRPVATAGDVTIWQRIPGA